MSRVSIIIPCFNAGDYLAQAVASALAQTHQDFEVIVVDDGSHDERTLEVLESLDRSKVTVARQANGGPASARNHAVRIASGKYVLPLDADDLISPEYAKAAAEVLDARDDIGIVYCNATRFGVEEGPWTLPPYTLREMVIDNVIFCSAMYRRSDWESVGGYSEHLRRGMEDYDFWLKLLNAGRDVAKLDAAYFHYRILTSSRTSSFMEDRSQVVGTYAEIFRGNIDFFARNAEMLFEHRFELYRQIAHYRHRYGKIDGAIEARPWLKKIARGVFRFLR